MKKSIRLAIPALALLGPRLFITLILGADLAAAGSPASGGEPAPLRICATTPDLRSLAESLGGERVEVICFSQGLEDPHLIELRPGQVRALNRAELYLQVGLGIENAWLEPLMQRAQNDATKPGGPGNLNLGQGVRPLAGPAATPPPGSFHESGNPHYLLDPVEGLKAARAICDRLVTLRPAWEPFFDDRHRAFVDEWARVWFGPEVAARIDLGRLEDFASPEALEDDLSRWAREYRAQLGGVLGELAPFAGAGIVGDHDLWPYFARRFGLEVVAYLEPSPGAPPTTRHLREVIRRMQERGVKVVLTAPYFPPEHARLVARETGARVTPLAHQTGAAEGADSYLRMIAHNVAQLRAALTAGE